MKRKFKIFILFVLLKSTAFGQDFGELEKTVQAELKEKNAVGAGIAIVKKR